MPRSRAACLVFVLLGGCSRTNSSGLGVAPGGPAPDLGAIELDGGDQPIGPAAADARPVDLSPERPAPTPDGPPPDTAPPCANNPCGGCKPLPMAPGVSCGTCGVLACRGTDDLVCNDPGKNTCGGCKPLPSAPGTACGACGKTTCDGPEAVECADPGRNDCGGCKDLDGSPGDACGACGVFACNGKEALACKDLGRNACGGCAVLDDPPGTPCGNCGKLACKGPDTLACVEVVCSGDRPVCLASTCVECTPEARRCSSPAGVETCSSSGSWTGGDACPGDGRCHERDGEAACLEVTPALPDDGDRRPLRPPFTFSWMVSGALDGVRTCSVLLLDKGLRVQDGFGEEAFYVGAAREVTPTLDPFFFGLATFRWAVLTVACDDPAATCAQPCPNGRACAALGVLSHLPCQGTPVWSAERTLSTP